jgi:hypothetical protein
MRNLTGKRASLTLTFAIAHRWGQHVHSNSPALAAKRHRFVALGIHIPIHQRCDHRRRFAFRAVKCERVNQVVVAAADARAKCVLRPLQSPFTIHNQVKKHVAKPFTNENDGRYRY